jgi:hypothetical protein
MGAQDTGTSGVWRALPGACHASIFAGARSFRAAYQHGATPMPNKTYHDLVNEARTRVAEVSANETMQLQRDDPRTVVVDCREPNEAALGVVAGAVVIPRGVLEQNIERVAQRGQKVIIYCASGNRSLLAGETLQ